MQKIKKFQKMREIVFIVFLKQNIFELFLKHKTSLFIRTALFFFAMFLFFGFGASAQAAHPFLITKQADFAGLQAKASGLPWSSWKATAISDVNSKNYNANTPIRTKMNTMREILNGGAIAYVVDPANKNAYKNKVYNTIITGWTDLWDHRNNITNPYYFVPGKESWTWYVPIGSSFFDSVVALDIVYNDLTVTERTNVEFQLDRMEDWIITTYLGGAITSEYSASIRGIWALYNGDAATANTANTVYKNILVSGLFSSDGIYIDGPRYAMDKFDAVPERHHIAFFMDVLEFNGKNNYYSDPILKKAFEWLYGYAINPKKLYYSFGDTLPDSTPGALDAVYKAHKFSSLAAELGAWANGGLVSKPSMYVYVLAQTLPPVKKPTSKIFSDGGAWFLENSLSDNALAGVMWNVSNVNTGRQHHHDDVNALDLSAYGERVLRNSGYCVPPGWMNTPAECLGYTWDYIHNTAKSGNTVTINNIDHTIKNGGGITEGLIAGLFDYASGYSGNALPNGKHQRNLVFVHPQDGKNGYWILFDEVTSGSSPVNVFLHPNSNSSTTISANQEYSWQIAPVTHSANNTKVSVFLGTPPASATIFDSISAGLTSSGHTYIAEALDSKYNIGPGGKKNIVTVIFPSDATHAKATMSRITGSGYTGASITQGAIIDYALESSGGSVITHNSVKFQGLATWYRATSGNITSYFTRAGRSFDDGKASRQGFETDHNISIQMKDKIGMVTAVSSGGVKIYYPEINLVKIDGADAIVLSSGTGWMNINIPSGTHSIALNGAIAPVPAPVPIPTPTPPTPTIDTIDPAIEITCPVNSATPPATPPTYSSNTISVSGTASDNVGVSKVEVKVGPAGTYQTVTGTTSWSISGVTLAAGLNTVYAKVTDTSGNTKETSITVTYDSTTPPPPSVTCTKFVAKTGNDANSGTEASPWLTMQKAADVAVAGDTVCVKAGTYNESVIPKNSGNAGNWITFMAYPGTQPIVDGTGIGRGINDGLVHILHKSYIKFSGFKVQNSTGGGITVSGRGSAVPWSNVTIENNHTYNTEGGGIIGYGPGSNFIMNKNDIERACSSPGTRWMSEQVSLQGKINGFVFSNNEVHHNGQNYTDNWRGGEGPTFKEGVSNGKVFGNHIHHMKRTADINGKATGQTTGIYSDGFTLGVTNIDIYNNRVHDITGFGIVVNSEEQGTNESTTVRNNLVYNNSRWGIFLAHGGDDVSTGYVKNTKIINNTIYNNGERGIMVSRNIPLATGIIIRNNISANNGQSQLDIRNSDAVIDYNLTYGPGSTIGANPIIADPQFVNPAAFDFHLQPTSPAINAGSPTGAPAFDFANGPRPWPAGGAFDIGAYEYGSPPGPSSGNLPPTCTAPSATTCGNGLWDTSLNEVCEKDTNQGCFSPSICNSDCAACIAPPPPPSPCDGIVCSAPGSCQVGPGKCESTSSTTYVCAYPDDPQYCDLDGEVCTVDRCLSKDGGLTSSCVAGPDACGGLLPCGRMVDDPTTTEINESKPCSLCAMVYMGHLIIEFLVKISVVLAILSIAFGGFLYIFAAGSQETLEKAKSIIKYAIIGFIIILISWMIIDSILTTTGYIDPIDGEWYEMIC